ncbi:MAG: LuxR family transcriptional regulator [Amycolatopsis sp.]|jgi:hypothetical protein|uniref:hypothetical protein n=1 Tax=Amycolatopsis sp. TaxID=37632 RepID=UPI0026044189|nr:hypothetical protein [Amycolatopsis sp.]MCU1686276.1 LuxR family transcriptional regulator [Amycolatopsis sp.]
MKPKRLSAPGAQAAVVAVRASDPMTELGVATILGADRRLTVLADGDFALAEVIVVAEQLINGEVFAFLREVRAA